MRSSRLAVAAAAALVLLLGQVLRLPPLTDAATGAAFTGGALAFSAAYVLTAPFSLLADWVTLNSLRQDIVLIVWLLAGYWFYQFFRPAQRRRALLAYALYLAAVVAFLAWAALAPRPAARLALEDQDDLALDLHSHTSASHDGRRAFNIEANAAWHSRTGYGAGFVTEHNLFQGAEDAADGYRSLAGTELSLHDAHVVVLGPRARIDPEAYGGPAGLLRFLRESKGKHGALAVMSLPEYWQRHPPSGWEEFAVHGAAGFEIVNAAPKALDFPAELRRRVVDLCRRRGLFVAGASDQHGWGSAALAWNVMRLPGHRNLGSEDLQRMVMRGLRERGFEALRVAVRARGEPAPLPWLLLDPWLGLWTLARTLTPALALSCALWCWLACLAAPKNWF